MSEEFSIPADLARTNIDMRGAVGAEWLNRLPAIIAECERRWLLTVGPPFPRLSYNYATPARRADGTSVVLKIGFPDREFRTEAEALRVYNGEGAVQL